MGRTTKPIVGVTIGDPAGIGPEISVKALLKSSIYNICRPILVGDLSILEAISGNLGLNVRFRVIDSPCEARGERGLIEVIDLRNVDVKSLPIGVASAESGRASIEYIERAVYYALKGEINAIATAPINKKAINLAGSEHIGHTEILAALCGVKEPLTMFWVRGMRIFFLTRHMPLIEAIKAVKKDRIVSMTLKIKEALEHLGIKEPIIAVAALNPHASDEGLIGREEAEEIAPAIKELRGMGLNVIGPLPADSIFHQALERKFDAVLSLYHDQGHIAAKTLDFYGAVAITLGLPFIRTSVDHGTAYNIAWRGLANPRSLFKAIELAAKLSRVYSPMKG
ncbi:MAG: 4-hydroxythreonine-4-phosphate dehydrogenase PdxA [Candidatus Bathyarchaeia archaeon]|nr:4-hydroxythreonine-4-phosphate dehydrogenase PdxA [Candidatus Bathyarchaeota archaeon]